MSAKPMLYLDWNPKQAQFLECTEPFQNLEGGVRAGKSFVLCWKVFQYAAKYPGICIALTRYTQDGLDAMLKPVWRDVCRSAGVRPHWNTNEECDELPNGSRIYLRALKSGDDQQRYSKLAGLTLAILAIEEAAECPEDIYRHYVPARLSQPGFPKGVWISTNPPMPNSWIAREWPEKNDKPGHVLIKTNMFDNVDVLGQEYIDLQLAAYEPGTLEYRRLVEGKRGLIVAGKPIYARHFNEKRHVRNDLQAIPSAPLYECLDFGTKHPCVVWMQFPPGGRFHLLGGVMGSDLALEEFLPVVAEFRAQWFGDAPMVEWTCDPAGGARNSHGSKTGVQILRDHGIYPSIEENANYPPQRAFAIETTIGYLKRSAHDGEPLFLLNPRFAVVGAAERRYEAVLQDVFGGGYCYDPKRSYAGTTYGHLTPPSKDGWFEHPANAVEYGVLKFSPPDPAEAAGLARNPVAERRARQILEHQGISIPSGAQIQTLAADIQQARMRNAQEKAERQALRRAQRDSDEPVRYDRAAFGRGERPLGRGGY